MVNELTDKPLDGDLILLWISVTFVLMRSAPSDAGQVLSAIGLMGGVAAALGGVYVALPRGDLPKELPEETRA